MSNRKLLFADADGRVMEHPFLLATIRTGEQLLPPIDRPIALPEAGKLVQLPGRFPVGIHPDTGQFELLSEVKVRGKTVVPRAVGALLPPGYTRTFLPGEVQGNDSTVLPQWAYTAAAWTEKGPVAWGVKTDARTHWNPRNYDDAEIRQRVEAMCREFPGNRVLKQLSVCANLYRCMTSRNIFLRRDEGAIPASIMCNARCVGCISDQPKDGPPASHQRMDDGPSADEMGEVGTRHLMKATGRVMISFGQGCEGEPLTRWKAIAESIEYMRARTARGSININTNASLSKGLDALFEAGLDAVRVSLNSAEKSLYEAYYKPVRYSFEDVEESLRIARKRKAYIALNLLLFPGVTDREGEVKALVRLIKRHRVNQVQTRSLCIDPLQYLQVAQGNGKKGAAMGVRAMLRHLKAEVPGLVIGNFARGLNERSR